MKCFTLIIVSLLIAGCANPLFVTKSTAEKQLDTLKAQYSQQIALKTQEVATAKDNVITSKDNQLQSAANSFYAIDRVFGVIPSPLRTDILTHNYALEGWQSVNHLMPSYDTMVEINTRITRELDETKTSLAALQAEHDKVMGQNAQLSDVARAAQEKLDLVKAEDVKLKQDSATAIMAKQDDLDFINNKIIAANAQTIQNAKSDHDMKMKFSMIMGILSLAALAGAVYSPVFKQKFGIFSALMGVGAIGIWYIQPWMVGIVVAVIILGLVIWAVHNHSLESKTAENVYRALESVKTKANDVYVKTIKPELDEFQQKYTGDGVKVPDVAAIQHVDDVLIKVGDK